MRPTPCRSPSCASRVVARYKRRLRHQKGWGGAWRPWAAGSSCTLLPAAHSVGGASGRIRHTTMQEHGGGGGVVSTTAMVALLLGAYGHTPRGHPCRACTPRTRTRRRVRRDPSLAPLGRGRRALHRRGRREMQRRDTTAAVVVDSPLSTATAQWVAAAVAVAAAATAVVGARARVRRIRVRSSALQRSHAAVGRP